MRERFEHLAACAELDVDASELPSSAVGLSDAAILALMEDVAALANHAGRVQAVLAGVAARRSRREDGHSGLAAGLGHPSPTSLIQAITGGTRADAARQVRVGTALLDGEAPITAEVVEAGVAAAAAWHESLTRALLDGSLTAAQHDAVRCGLGDPQSAASTAAREAWSIAAESLIAEASGMPVEELAKRARTVRDTLDPIGAEERYARRFDGRSFRMWVDSDGQHRARIAFDDEMAIWVRTFRDAALRPRRGGPRFVTEEERAIAEELIADGRTNEQLEYDLIMDVLRAGALASAADVFGARQPGVRMIVVTDAASGGDAAAPVIGHAEDGGDALPGSVIDRARCTTGSVQLSVDRTGNPLDLGREQRLYSSRQRLALAARDGGCLWPGCTRPASYCEAHHCDHFAEDDGRTDIDRGALVCRFHHMFLHNKGWRIKREGKGPFILHPPPGEGPPVVLASKAPWKRAWDPPPPLERAGWRSG